MPRQHYGPHQPLIFLSPSVRLRSRFAKRGRGRPPKPHRTPPPCCHHDLPTRSPPHSPLGRSRRTRVVGKATRRILAPLSRTKGPGRDLPPLKLAEAPGPWRLRASRRPREPPARTVDWVRSPGAPAGCRRRRLVERVVSRLTRFADDDDFSQPRRQRESRGEGGAHSADMAP